MRRKTVPKVVTWLSDEVYNPQSLSQSFKHYTKFKFGNIVAEIGDFVLISNADAAEPDTEAGCDAARIVSLYEDSTNTQDPFRAKVQWYSRPIDLPKWCLNNMDLNHFLDKEVIEDHRPFNTDISIETIFKKCTISFKLTKDVDRYIQEPLHYICRYRLIALSRRKVNIEPILEEERNARALLATPFKRSPAQNMETPNSLVKRMSRVSLTEQKNWSVTKNDGTKLLLKRAILADKNEKEPKTPKSSAKETPKRYQKVTENNIEEILSMELKENSDEDLPTLIIRQHVMTTPRRKQLTSNKDNFQKSPSVQHMPTTPKRKQSIAKTDEYTPKKVLVFDEDSISSQSRRSRRITRKSFNYVENDISPIKKTPVRKPRNSESDEDFKPALKMSRTPRTPRTPKTCTPSKSVSRRIITSQLTPSLKSRTHSIERDDLLGKENKSLPGREGQLDEILSFVRNKLLDRTSGCMYISGVPGTGKTATVCTALQMLKEEPDLPDFHLIEVNGMKITEPRQAYVQMYRQLTGKTVVWEQACSLLEKRFTNPGTKRTPTVLLVDELDALCTRRQDVLYSIMEWAAHNIAQLTVLAVANTMDLPERALAARVASRLGLTRLTFPPYTHTQLQKIVVTRLHGANVTPDAVQLIARKVAAVSGDARRALALCVMALELAGPGGAGLKEVERALGDTNASAAVRAIRGCSPAEKLMLRAVASEVERTGSDETTLSRALLTAAALVALEGRPYKTAASIREPTPLQAQAICSRLAALRLLLLEPKPLEPRLLLNVSTDDVHYATKQINV